MAGRITKSFIDQLLVRTDIVEIVSRAVQLKKAGRDFQGLCPFHTEKTPSFTVSPDKQFYHCFGCGAHGSAIGFVMNHDGLAFAEAVHDLASRVGLTVEYEGGSALPSENYTALYGVLAEAERLYARLLRDHPQRAHAVDYLKRRGLTGEIAKRFGIGYAPNNWDTILAAQGASAAQQALLMQAGLTIERDGGGYYDRFRDRIMFPIHDRRGRCIGFGGRIIDQGEPKYLNSPETPVFHKRRELYGLNHVVKAPGPVSRVLIVEGYLDVVALAQHGIENAVATLGTATTPEQLEQLFRVVPDLVFCFDGDAAGKRASWKALEVALPLMQDGRRISFLFLPQGQDPDSLVRSAGTAPFRDPANVIGLSEHLFQELVKQTELETLEGRARLAALARPLIQKVPTGTFRQLLVEHLGQLAQTQVSVPTTALPPKPRQEPIRAQLAAPRRRGKSVQPVLDRAISLLLRDPSLAPLGNDLPAMDITSNPKLALLITLLEQLRETPTLTTGALLEGLRGMPQQTIAEEILGQKVVLGPEHWAEEFKGSLAQIMHHARRNFFGKLLDGATPNPRDLGPAARARLQQRPPPDKH
ncbi:MAG: DNA primase [Gammaproteobacteria bacterium]|nr:DNA primase [Gammaproteobacteria bacterium]